MHINMVYKKASRLACIFTGLGDSGCLLQINKCKLLDSVHTDPVHKAMLVLVSVPTLELFVHSSV